MARPPPSTLRPKRGCEVDSPFLSPIVQYGFAGFCAVLLGIVVWLMNRVMQLIEQNNKVVSDNTAVMIKIHEQSDKTKEAVWEMREEFLRRPCIAKLP
jgi:hypothetical protein